MTGCMFDHPATRRHHGGPVLPALVAGKRVTLCTNHSRPEWAEYARNYFGGEAA